MYLSDQLLTRMQMRLRTQNNKNKMWVPLSSQNLKTKPFIHSQTHFAFSHFHIPTKPWKQSQIQHQHHSNPFPSFNSIPIITL